LFVGEHCMKDRIFFLVVDNAYLNHDSKTFSPLLSILAQSLSRR
jgi:hypothetical protein